MWLLRLVWLRRWLVSQEDILSRAFFLLAHCEVAFFHVVVDAALHSQEEV